MSQPLRREPQIKVLWVNIEQIPTHAPPDKLEARVVTEHRCDMPHKQNRASRQLHFEPIAVYFQV